MRLYTRKLNLNGMSKVSVISSEDKFFEEFDERTCCSGPRINEDEGYQVCANCGFIFSRIYDETPRRSYTPEEKRNRIINEVVINPIGPRTVFQGNKDANGRLLNPKHASFFKKLSKINKSIFSSYERNLYTAFPIFERLQERLALPYNIINDALRIYTFTVKKKYTMGRSIESLISAAIFSVIRIYGLTITLDEILEITNVEKKKCVRDYGFFRIHVLPQLNFKVKVTPLTADRYIDRFSEDLGLSMSCRNQAIKILKIAIKRGYNPSGKDPKGIAAALLYTVSQKNGEIRTQKEICKTSQVTQVTLRNRRRELIESSKIL